MVQFPEQFRWGTGTYSYQVEGAAHEDGRGESIWDRFCATPGTIVNNESGLVACDHYHRYAEDIALLKQLGVQMYHFSIAWPRIMPTGRGPVNQLGLDFYDRLVDALLEAGIEPFATLYHWDLPQALQDELGGWANRETAYAFAEYVDVVTKHFGSRIHNWLTLNEPAVTAFEGHEIGIHAPGARDVRLAWQTTHHFLLAHGLAVPIIRANGDEKTRVGITLNFTQLDPVSDTPEDVAATRFMDGKMHRWFLDPIFRGAYPADVVKHLGDYVPKTETGDAEIIARPLDFLGANYYTRSVIKHDPTAFSEYPSVDVEGVEHTEMDWEVYPRGIYNMLTRLHREYAVPRIYLVENGAAFADAVNPDDTVDDPRRIAYLREHLLQVHTAIAEGVPLAGYSVWALLDNFEWSEGYRMRFGIVYVDYPTQKRIMKASGHWYQKVIASNTVH
ncbi:GH1 family beta-glucosidase [Dictyobacter arantiisoli]|uniref:Beta-glucosidase n=1 Tax=Dictyobacter arantiisoli TaxID=2014874 RepID=A0A5A5TBU7_9CHLR|nr:GH1 family beta-glucosidase [Dictyobacter arantiisoli]GCF08404.1 beta-glucosidase [Dictyobacter arantiisoli]